MKVFFRKDERKISEKEGGKEEGDEGEEREKGIRVPYVQADRCLPTFFR